MRADATSSAGAPSSCNSRARPRRRRACRPPRTRRGLNRSRGRRCVELRGALSLARERHCLRDLASAIAALAGFDADDFGACRAGARDAWFALFVPAAGARGAFGFDLGEAEAAELGFGAHDGGAFGTGALIALAYGFLIEAGLIAREHGGEQNCER